LELRVGNEKLFDPIYRSSTYQFKSYPSKAIELSQRDKSTFTLQIFNRIVAA
jgi:hypothetical protein